MQMYVLLLKKYVFLHTCIIGILNMLFHSNGEEDTTFIPKSLG